MDIELPPFKIEKIMSSLSQSSGWGVKELNIPSIWKETTGEGVTIGVIDTGLPQHEDIGDNAVKGRSFIKGQDIFDRNGHQTHCVGIISAKNNTQGMVGVAPSAKCLCVKGLSDQGSGSYQAIADAINYCVKQEVDLISSL